MANCPVCTSAPTNTETTTGDKTLFDCPRCGRFVVTGTALAGMEARIAEKPELRTILSHYIRKGQGASAPVTLTTTTLDAIASNESMPTPEEQRESLILWVGQNQLAPARHATTNVSSLAAVIGAEATPNSSSEVGFSWLIGQVKHEDVFEVNGEAGKIQLRLTMKGWGLYQELKRKVADSFTAFMAMQFNDGELNHVLAECFKPAVKKAGFDLRPLNEGQGAGLIDNQIRTAIRRAAFVLADLTHDNNGAYFEAGFAEGLGVPVIYTCKKDKFDARKTHFDTNHMVTVPWDAGNLGDAGARLTATIRATLPGRANMSDD